MRWTRLPEMDIYVYYRVTLPNTSALHLRLQTMQRSLTEQHNISCSLKRRPELSDGCQTWMEVYQQVPEHFAATLEGAVASHEVMALIAGERHVETFVDIEACA